MSFLQKLLAGTEVEWKTLGEIAKIQRGASPRPIAQYITDDVDGVPWIKIGDTSSGSKYVKNTAQKITIEGAKKSRVLKKGDFIISNSMSFGRPYILDINGAIHDGWASISNFEEKLNSDFLYHYLSSNGVQNYWLSKINSGSVSNLNADIIKTLLIPIPCPENPKKSLEIQTEIVRILDEFSALTAELTTELTTELNVRKKQYNYYRERLLNFKDGEVEWLTLGDLCNFVSSGKNKNKSSEGEYPVYGSTGVIARTDKYAYSGKQILVARVGANAGYVHLADGHYDVSDNTIIVNIKDDHNLKFLFYILQNMRLRQYAKGAGQPLITSGQLKEFKIPIPSLGEQARIVSILDKFDVSISSITKGLPREINLRQQQYEYYRDLLFSFPKSEDVEA